MYISEDDELLKLLPSLVHHISGRFDIRIKDYKKWLKGFKERTGKSFGTTRCDITGKIIYDEIRKLEKRRWYSVEVDGWTITRYKEIDNLLGTHKYWVEIKGCPAVQIADLMGIDANITIWDLKVELTKLTFLLGIPLHKINIMAPTEIPSLTLQPNLVITDLQRLMVYKFGNCFKPQHSRNGKGPLMGYYCSKSNFSHSELKIYLPDVKNDYKYGETGILRLERHYSKWSPDSIQTTGFKTFEDLLNPMLHKHACELLLDIWQRIVVCDSTLKRGANGQYLNRMINNGANPNFWSGEFKTFAKDARTLYKYLNEYNHLSFKKGHGMHAHIASQIKNEIEKFPKLSSS